MKEFGVWEGLYVFFLFFFFQGGGGGGSGGGLWAGYHTRMHTRSRTHLCLPKAI